MRTYKQLQQELKLTHDLPYTEDWSAAADFLFLLKDYCLCEKPEVIVECSSGLSSLILARCCQLNEIGRVYSLENGEEFQQQTIANLKQFKLDEYADIYLSPLTKVRVDQIEYDWYSTQQLPEFKIDMLVIDGPPGYIQKNSRLPALHILFEQLADKSCIYLDDAARDDEKEMVKIWLNKFTGLTHEYLETERGCSIIKINKM
jgi:predicted O-methyltransferase YrrM